MSLFYCYRCYNDKTRYTSLIVLYIIDLIFFIIRLSLVANDLSCQVSATMSFLVPILLFDLIASVPLLICNGLYLTMRYCIDPLVHDVFLHRSVWRFATLTCIRLDCHRERPQGILLTRLAFIIVFFILRFICFVVGASCSARFRAQCTAYAIFAAFALVVFFVIVLLELIHFFRLWTYNPTKGKGSANQIGEMDSGSIVDRTHRRHLRFIDYSLLNDQNAGGFRQSRCPDGVQCQSRGLHHHLFYHSLNSERDIDAELVDETLKKSFVAFHHADKEAAYAIARKGFPYGDAAGANKEYLRLDKKVFFTPHCATGASSSEAIVCVSLNLNRITIAESDTKLDLDKYFALGDGQCDTVYVKSTKRLYLRMPAQVERWIIAIDKDMAVNDRVDEIWYRQCV